jgi:hypothetical protein
MKIQYNKEKYSMKKQQIAIDEYQFNLIPKKRNCKCCNKRFDSVGKEFLTWTDDNGFLRSGYFCKVHYILIKKALKEVCK